MSDSSKLPPLEEGILMAMRAIDNQIAREMQRSPEDLERQGVQKWEPINSRIELVASYVLNLLGEEAIGLDSLLVMAQAMTKSLELVTQDLSTEGLGKVRTGYCVGAFESISASAFKALSSLKGEPEMV